MLSVTELTVSVKFVLVFSINNLYESPELAPDSVNEPNASPSVKRNRAWVVPPLSVILPKSKFDETQSTEYSKVVISSLLPIANPDALGGVTFSGIPLGGRDFVVIPELGLKYSVPFIVILVNPVAKYLYKGYL